MKKSQLKQIIREEYQTVTGKPISMLTEESIITKILYLFLSPKVKRDISKIKKSPEYIELERQATLLAKTLEPINKRLDRIYNNRIELEKEAKKYGIKVSANMTYDEIMAQHPQHTKLHSLLKKTNK